MWQHCIEPPPLKQIFNDCKQRNCDNKNTGEIQREQWAFSRSIGARECRPLTILLMGAVNCDVWVLPYLKIGKERKICTSLCSHVWSERTKQNKNSTNKLKLSKAFFYYYFTAVLLFFYCSSHAIDTSSTTDQWRDVGRLYSTSYLTLTNMHKS